MDKKRIVVALGRNAFGILFPDQKKAVANAANAIADLVEDKYQLAITFSNGPQVGMLHTAMTEFSRLSPEYTVAPMSVCGALSQGYIGYDLQNAIRTELLNRGIFKPVSTIITQVRVDPFDEAFSEPTKVLGRYMSEDEARAETSKGNYVVKEEKGYRRIVAAPKPIDIYEIDAVRALLDADQLVIAGGGGGIPVLQQGTRLKGASAVIEKDLTAARMADMLDADGLLFLTGTEKVAIHYKQPGETFLDKLSVSQARIYMEQEQFEAGSMLPKIEASVEFVSSRPGRKAIITDLSKAREGMAGKTGTLITAE
ncbi:MAG: carbamate kinase [Lachnospiraceae bacterium]|nr:carbamate kinase [Lachnospiraceae bacterium]